MCKIRIKVLNENNWIWKKYWRFLSSSSRIRVWPRPAVHHAVVVIELFTDIVKQIYFCLRRFTMTIRRNTISKRIRSRKTNLFCIKVFFVNSLSASVRQNDVVGILTSAKIKPLWSEMTDTPKYTLDSKWSQQWLALVCKWGCVYLEDDVI